MGGLPLSRLLDVLDHMTFLRGVSDDLEFNNHDNNNNNHNNHNHDNHNNHNNNINNNSTISTATITTDIKTSSRSRSSLERSEKLELARRRLCSDVESLKLAIHRLQLQGEVEVVLVNTTVDANAATIDGITNANISTANISTTSTSNSTSGNKGGSVEICVRLLGEVLPIQDPSNTDDEINTGNSARARGEGNEKGTILR